VPRRSRRRATPSWPPLAPGYDFTREILLTAELGLGDTSLIDGEDGLDALVLWHSAPLAEGSAEG